MSKEKNTPKNKPTPPKPTTPVRPPKSGEKMAAEAPPRTPPVKPTKK